ncbi:MAG: ribonuclease P protein component [Oscillospiraceae bacterium]|nr:ribonuclease P protein component [Oscillospiraceae bacterium]
MKRHFSLKQNRDFQRLYRKGKYAATSTLVIYWRPNRLDHNRLGITASS